MATPWLRSAALVQRLSASQRTFTTRVVSRLFTRRAIRLETTIPGSTGPIDATIYEPEGAKDPPVLVLVHGFVERAERTPRIAYLGALLSETGFRVVVPRIHSEQQQLMRSDGATQLGEVVDWSYHRYGRKVALIGASFGGGLSLRVASEPRFRYELKMVAAISGYNSLLRLGNYYLGEEAVSPSGVPYPKPPFAAGPLLIAYQFPDEMFSREDGVKLLPAIQAILFDREPENLKAALSTLSPQQQKLLAEIRDVSTPEARRHYHNLMRNNQADLDDISPKGHLSDITAPVYLLHGSDDHIVPAGEAEWNMAELVHHPDTHLLISPAMVHSDLDSSASRGNKLRVAWFLVRLLHAART